MAVQASLSPLPHFTRYCRTRTEVLEGHAHWELPYPAYVVEFEMAVDTDLEESQVSQVSRVGVVREGLWPSAGTGRVQDGVQV